MAAKITYQMKGENPKLLIMSGMHGDEPGVVESTKRAVKKLFATLPDFMYIPVASPSAYKLKTRKNSEGMDLNRSFFDQPKCQEAVQIMKIVKGRTFDTCIVLHEDPEFSEFYIYDAFGPNWENTPQLSSFQEEIFSLGVPLLNGIDDPSDPDLGFKFVDGYHHSPSVKVNTDGLFSHWANCAGIVKRYLNPEIPGKLPQAKKDKIVEIVLEVFTQIYP